MGNAADQQQDLNEALVRMGLLVPGETPELHPLDGGISSDILRARTSAGEFCVKRALPQLKVPVEWKVPVDRNSAEVGWMRFAERVTPGSVPAVLGEDEEAKAFAMAWLDPRDHPVWKSQLLDGRADVATARAVGEILSAIHNASAGDPAVAQEFANDGNFHAIRLDPYFGTSAPERHPDCAQALHTLIERTASTRRTLVHGDVSPKNILVGPSGPVFLDAECAWYGDPAFDLAFCMAHLFLKCVHRPDVTAAFLACFDAFSTANIEGVRWEPPAELEARTCVMLAGMVLARIDGKSPVEYITEESEKDRVRAFARGFLLEPVERLASMRDAWQEEWQA
jgi:aminoglycoside phosphotransferase (APT) family kinase protein